MEKRYVMTDNKRSITISGVEHILYQICALRTIYNPFMNIRKGQLGGFIESERQLSQKGESWIDENSLVIGNSRIKESAFLSNTTVIDAWIHGKAFLNDVKFISDDNNKPAIIYEQAYIHKTHIIGGSIVLGNVAISLSLINDTILRDSVSVSKAQIKGSILQDDVKIVNSIIHDSEIYGNGEIDNSKIIGITQKLNFVTIQNATISYLSIKED